MSGKNEVAEKPKQSFSLALSESLNEVRGALPKELNTERFVQNAVALLNENTTLADFAKQYGTGQIKQGLMKGAFLGLDALNSEFYLIPYKNVLSFMVDYRGNVKLAKKYSIRTNDRPLSLPLRISPPLLFVVWTFSLPYPKKT